MRRILCLPQNYKRCFLLTLGPSLMNTGTGWSIMTNISLSCVSSDINTSSDTFVACTTFFTNFTFCNESHNLGYLGWNPSYIPISSCFFTHTPTSKSLVIHCLNAVFYRHDNSGFPISHRKFKSLEIIHGGGVSAVIFFSLEMWEMWDTRNWLLVPTLGIRCLYFNFINK